MRVAVIRFPGSNCDQDAYHALRDDLHLEAEYVWHEDRSLAGFDAAFLPGGFSYGDYLRCGAMAARAPIMDEVVRFAKAGQPVLGACNGFQVLCEAGLLPGALLPNESQHFVCKDVILKPQNQTSFWTDGIDRPIRLPIAHGEGRYICDEQTLLELKADDRIAFRYVDSEGNPTPESNPNGSIDNIAGVLNEKGNVLGLMPHPERATRSICGSTDGFYVLRALTKIAARR